MHPKLEKIIEQNLNNHEQMLMELAEVTQQMTAATIC